MAANGKYYGPGHASILPEGTTEWLSFHYYDGEDSGRAKLGWRKLQWKDGWPVADAN
jgi:arabinan endo-1,5-alpha-L-arabinosidase